MIATGASAAANVTHGTDARSFAERACAAALRPIDGAWLAALRIAFGVLLAVSMFRFSAYGWVERFFVAPRFHFTYWGFSWVEPLPAAGMHALFWVLLVLAIAIALGVAFRSSATLFALGLSYVQLIDVTTYLNHYYLAALVAWLLALSPAGQLWSIDAWLRTRRAPPGAAAARPSVPAGFLYLFRFQVALVYTFAGLAKLQSDWLWHAQPLRIWLGAKVDLPVIGPLLTLAWLPVAMSWAGFLFDSTIVVWLSWRRSRPWAYAAVIAFHVMTRVLFPIGMFPAIMITAALVFFSPSWPRTLLARLRRRRLPLPAAPAETASPGPISAKARWAIACGALFCAVQLALPLRAAAYGGNVLWHEQGMRFSWRVMLRAKGGSTTFIVRDKQSGRSVYVSPRAYLTDLQEGEMSSQPDLILQLAHHIRDDYARRGFHEPEVRVDSRVSLNGRRSVPLIDPTVDLSTIHDGLGRAEWITPAPLNPPPHTRPVL